MVKIGCTSAKLISKLQALLSVCTIFASQAKIGRTSAKLISKLQALLSVCTIFVTQDRPHLGILIAASQL